MWREEKQNKKIKKLKKTRKKSKRREKWYDDDNRPTRYHDIRQNKWTHVEFLGLETIGLWATFSPVHSHYSLKNTWKVEEKTPNGRPILELILSHRQSVTQNCSHVCINGRTYGQMNEWIYKMQCKMCNVTRNRHGFSIRWLFQFYVALWANEEWSNQIIIIIIQVNETKTFIIFIYCFTCRMPPQPTFTGSSQITHCKLLQTWVAYVQKWFVCSFLTLSSHARFPK